MITNVLLILAVLLLIILAGIFSGAETGIYQLSRLRLRLGIEKKQLLFIILGRLFKKSPALLITILVGNNLANYAATTIITCIFLSAFKVEHTAELVATAVTAPALFVFSELIPKNIFFYRSDALLPYAAPVLYVFHKLFYWSGITPLLAFISRTFAAISGSGPPAATTVTARPSYIKSIVQETREEAFLSPVQTDLINRLANISGLSIKSVMTPINKVQTVDIKCDNSILLNILRESPYTRLPVYKHQPTNIIGFIDIYDALSSEQRFTDLHNFTKLIRSLSSDTPITVAINIMQKENEKIVLVTAAGQPKRQKPLGIITMKDLVEELLGELAEW